MLIFAPLIFHPARRPSLPGDTMTNQGTLYIVSAPSGAGKSSLIQALLATGKHDAAVSVSHTTRAPRPGEVDGVHYHFVSQEQFRQMIELGEFYEWAEVFGNYYGTSKGAIDRQLAQGTDVFLDIDWQGARQIREVAPDCQSIFIMPPSREELHDRLKRRGQDSEAVIAGRMAEAISEMSHYDEYDYLLINDNFEQTIEAFGAILLAKRLQTAGQARQNTDILKNLLAE